MINKKENIVKIIGIILLAAGAFFGIMDLISAFRDDFLLYFGTILEYALTAIVGLDIITDGKNHKTLRAVTLILALLAIVFAFVKIFTHLEIGFSLLNSLGSSILSIIGYVLLPRDVLPAVRKGPAKLVSPGFILGIGLIVFVVFAFGQCSADSGYHDDVDMLHNPDGSLNWDTVEAIWDAQD